MEQTVREKTCPKRIMTAERIYRVVTEVIVAAVGLVGGIFSSNPYLYLATIIAVVALKALEHFINRHLIPELENIHLRLHEITANHEIELERIRSLKILPLEKQQLEKLLETLNGLTRSLEKIMGITSGETAGEQHEELEEGQRSEEATPEGEEETREQQEPRQVLPGENIPAEENVEKENWQQPL